MKEEPLGADFGLGYYTTKMKFKGYDPELEQRHIYAHLGYAFTDDFYGYGNLGASDMTVENADSTFNPFGDAITVDLEGQYKSGFSYGAAINYNF